MASTVGRKTAGTLTFVQDSDSPDENIETLPGKIYRLEMQLSRPAEDEIDLIVSEIAKMKQEFPVSITFAEVNGDKLTLELYDHPAVPILLLVLGIIVLLGLLLLTIISWIAFLIIESLPTEFKGPAIIGMLALAGIAGVAGIMYFAGRKKGY